MGVSSWQHVLLTPENFCLVAEIMSRCIAVTVLREAHVASSCRNPNNCCDLWQRYQLGSTDGMTRVDSLF